MDDKSKDHRVGPWEPAADHGYSAHDRPWVLRRKNTKWQGHVETMLTADCRYRRFATETAALKCAEKLNAAVPNASGKPTTGCATGGRLKGE